MHSPPIEKLAIVSDYAGEIFARGVAQRLGCEYIHVDMRPKPDGEPVPKTLGNVRGRDVYYICPFYPNPLQRFAEIAIVNSNLRYSDPESLTSVPTYLGFMRQDKKDEARVPITIRTVAESVMEPYVDRVLTMEMHAAQEQGIFRLPLDHLDGTVLVLGHLRHQLFPEINIDLSRYSFVSPDFGGMMRVRALAKRAKVLEIAVIDKKRDPVTGEPTALNVIGDVEGKTCILFDDVISTGKSQQKATVALMGRGAERVYGYAIHAVMAPENGIAAEYRLEQSGMRRTLISDTIPRPESYFLEHAGQIGSFTAMNHFADAIGRLFRKESISELYNTNDV